MIVFTGHRRVNGPSQFNASTVQHGGGARTAPTHGFISRPGYPTAAAAAPGLFPGQTVAYTTTAQVCLSFQ